MNEELREQQRELCERLGVPWVESPDSLKVGIARNIKMGARPVNGLRHPPQGDTTGWYIWGGEEMEDDPSFFVPVHVRHLIEWCPAVIRYLGLPPGWRFLFDGEYEDVWEDASLLDV